MRRPAPVPLHGPHSLSNASGRAPPAGSPGPRTAHAPQDYGPENTGVRNIGLHPPGTQWTRMNCGRVFGPSIAYAMMFPILAAVSTKGSSAMWV